MDDKWYKPAEKKPEDGSAVKWIDSVGLVHEGYFEKGLWWFKDRSMYIYYIPTFWQYR